MSLFAEFQSLADEQWVVGAVNYDEDLHFSSYYLRASLRSSDEISVGYRYIAGFYENGNETYYLLRRECEEVANELLRHATHDPEWLANVLREVISHSAGLETLFDEGTTAEMLRRYTNGELVALYERHHAKNTTMYRWARLPEALDRGVLTFTTYLRDYLNARDVPVEATDEIFLRLTQPTSESVLAEELINFQRLVDATRGYLADKPLAPTSPGRLRMILPPPILGALQEHVRRWRYLNYHGYGRRELGHLDDYLLRLLAALENPAKEVRVAGIRSRLAHNADARVELCRKHHIDNDHMRLFELYAQIGSAKLYRRFRQITNFYYLDLLLAEIALRLGVPEWCVRCLLPQEIVASIRERRPLPVDIHDRGGSCAFLLTEKEELLISSKADIDTLRQLLQAAAYEEHRPGTLRGVVASPGHVIAPCKILIRADAETTDFEAGEILVSEATDPDLLPFLPIAAGVLTEQGGVTSHAAVICRELGVPAVLGIRDLLKTVHDGDILEMDGRDGTVTVLSPSALPSGVVLGPSKSDTPGMGGKAAGLLRLRDAGLPVPPFELLSYSGVKSILDANTESAIADLAQWLRYRLRLGSGETLALRSSAIGEDMATQSHAGAFRSILNVTPALLSTALREFVRLNDLLEGGYQGTIIVQRMLNPLVGGVCITSDPQIHNGTVTIIEMAMGGNQAITSGSITPARILIDRDTNDIIESTAHDVVTKISPLQLATFCRGLEAMFHGPVDVEWASDSDGLMLLQVRNVTSRS